MAFKVFTRDSHVHRKLSSLTTLWTFITMCATIVVFKGTIGHWKIRGTEVSSIQCKVRCRNESNAVRQKRMPVVESDLKKRLRYDF